MAVGARPRLPRISWRMGRPSGARIGKGESEHRIRSLPDGLRRELLSAEGEESLRLLAARGDQSAVDALLRLHSDWVRDAAARQANRGLTASELVQAGLIGLAACLQEAADDQETFEKRARALIDRSIQEEIAAFVGARLSDRLVVEDAQRYQLVETQIGRETGRVPKAEEIARVARWDSERTRALADLVSDARRRYDAEMLLIVEEDGEASDPSPDDLA